MFDKKTKTNPKAGKKTNTNAKTDKRIFGEFRYLQFEY